MTKHINICLHSCIYCFHLHLKWWQSWEQERGVCVPNKDAAWIPGWATSRGDQSIFRPKASPGGPLFTHAHLRSSRLPTSFVSSVAVLHNPLLFFFFLSQLELLDENHYFLKEHANVWIHGQQRARRKREGGRGRALFETSKLGCLCVNPRICFRMKGGKHTFVPLIGCPHTMKGSALVLHVHICVCSPCVSLWMRDIQST